MTLRIDTIGKHGYFHMLGSSLFRKEDVVTLKLTAIFEKVPEGYIGFVEELPGANSQGATLEETRENLKEAVELVMEANRMLAEESLKSRPVIRETIVLPLK